MLLELANKPNTSVNNKIQVDKKLKYVTNKNVV